MAHRTSVEDAREYIVANLSEPLRVKEIAAAAGVAPAHFCGIFRRTVGQTVHAYVRERRLRAAYDLLPDFRGNLSQLALEVGFAGASHFSGAFRQQFGETPAAAGDRLGADDPSVILDALAREMGHGEARRLC